MDNELKVLRHKADYMQEKLFKEQKIEIEQEKELEKLKDKLRKANNYELQVMAKAKKLYKIDFEDASKQ